MVQAAKEVRHFDAQCDSLLPQVVEIRIACDGAPAQRVLVLELHHDHVAALVNLPGGDDRQDLVVPVVVPLEILRIGRADPHRRLELQPDGIAARVPLGADIRPRADDRIQAELFRRIEERAKILVARKVPLVLLGLVEVPEGISLDAIEAGPFQPQQAVPPQLMRHAGVVDAARGDIRPPAVDGKPLAVDLDGLLRRRRGRVHEVIGRGGGGDQRKQDGKVFHG